LKILTCLFLAMSLLILSAPPVAVSQRTLTPEEIRREGRAACIGLTNCLRQARSTRSAKLANCRTSSWLSGTCEGIGYVGMYLRVPGVGVACDTSLAILTWECRFDANDDYRKTKRSCCTTYLQLRYGYDWPASLCGNHGACR